MRKSLMDVLWDEVKKGFKRECEQLGMDFEELWSDYQMDLIHKSQGVENVRT